MSKTPKNKIQMYKSLTKYGAITRLYSRRNKNHCKWHRLGNLKIRKHLISNSQEVADIQISTYST